ncbi:MAG: AI-2E family transporter [Erysipelotrichales bacterium]
MDIINKIKANSSLRRTFVIAVVCFAIYLLRDMKNIMLLTLIFIFLSSRLVNYITKKTRVPHTAVVIVLYLIIVGFIAFTINHYIYELINQTSNLANTLINFYEHPQTENNFILKWISENLSQVDLKKQIESGLNVILSYATNIGSIGMGIFISFTLSFFFMIESNRVKQFSRSFTKGKLSWFWNDLYYLGRKFINTFGVVLETQFIIATINTILTVIALHFLGFNQLLSLSFIIFILSLIPVAGVLISCIPLSIIAYTIGGIEKVFYVLIIIAIIHAIETYILNPKLMSNKTHLPIFYVFIVLFFSENIFGAWGLIIGIPIFVFILDLLDVSTLEINKAIKPFGVNRKEKTEN